MRKPAAAPALLACAAALGLGCASVDPKPFAAFAGATAQLREGADAALGSFVAPVRERAVAQIVEATASADGFRETRERYVLERPAGSLVPDRSKLALVFQLPVFSQGVYQLNSVLVDYANLLHQLALPETVPKDEIEALAKQLNANLVDAAKTIRPGQAVDTGRIALFSTAAAAATQAWLESVRRRHLRDAIDEDRAAIEAVSQLGQEAVGIMGDLLQKEYDDAKAEPLRVLARGPTGRSSEAQRRKAAQSLIALDEAYLNRSSALETLDGAYRALPSAQAELASAVADPKLTLASIQQLYDAGRRLQRLHAELAGAGGQP
jgi:hypothetical protein